MKRAAWSTLVLCCLLSTRCVSSGRYVDVEPIYEPVQQVHQSFYRDPAFISKGKRLAIMDFKASGGEGQVFADTLAAQLFAAGFKVSERQNVAILQQELKMAQSGAQNLTDTQILQKIGQMADVDVVIVGGVVTYAEEVSKLQFEQSIELPFSIWDQGVVGADPQRETVPAGITLYRWKPGSYRSPAGLPVQANIYASARGIEVATGKIVWIDTVNVQTSGITQITGLERMGRVMAGNFAATYDDALQLFVWNGEKFTYPENWEQVKAAWQKYRRQQQAFQ